MSVNLPGLSAGAGTLVIIVSRGKGRGFIPLAGTPHNKYEHRIRFIPLARGTALVNPHSQTWRFIPAGAGNTPTLRKKIEKKFQFIPAGAGEHRTCSANASRTRFYPRWRGEHCQYSLFSWSRCRFIPAGAGNFLLLVPLSTTPVYPAGAGTQMVLAGIPRRRGLSPLARGTPRVEFDGAYQCGLSRWRGNALSGGAGNS
ncbi:hypothetical protein KCP75_15265 [Salmonella enterica subsp. enterica]|nr:hypothetical protein KCP75_15265 [Salmonella enterica subsp. enterica]